MANGRIKSSERGLMPNAILIKMADGRELVVPSNKHENSLANMVVASQIRQLIQTNIREYKDSERLLTPKELKDLADAGSALVKFSGEVYDSSDPIDKKTVDTDDIGPSEIRFDDLDKLGFGTKTKKPDDDPAIEGDT